MSDMDLFPLLMTQVWSIPHLAIYSAGVVLSVRARQRLPSHAKRCLIAFVILLLSQLVASVTQMWQFNALTLGYTHTLISSILSTVGLLKLFMDVVAWSLLLIVLFDRPRAEVR